MIQMFLLAVLFILTLTIQSSFVMGLGEPFALVSLPVILGTLVLHRGSVYHGIAWFTLVALLQWVFGFSLFTFWIYPVLAVVGYFLVKRLFTTRSTYAYAGLLIVLLTLAHTLQWLANWQIELSDWLLTVLFALPLGYLAILSARAIETFFAQFLYQRS
jgi:hypothetical protein